MSKSKSVMQSKPVRRALAKAKRTTVSLTTATTPAVIETPSGGCASTTATPPPSGSASTHESTGVVPATTSSTATTSPALAEGIAMPPAVTIPAPPKGAVLQVLNQFRGFHPTLAQLGAAPQVITDLGRFADYEALFGASAPPAESVSQALTVGLAWRELRDPTETWDAYVRGQDGAAWQAALLLLDQLKPLFLIATARNPALASKYPGLAQMFAAAKKTAKRAQTTKKNNAKAKAVAAEAAATADAAKAATEAATVSPPKAVTVNA